MKFDAVILLAFLSVSALAGARMAVPSLPEAATPDAEVSTNIALNIDAARLQALALSVAFDSAWNLVKVVRRGLGEIGETVEVGEERVRFDIRIR